MIGCVQGVFDVPAAFAGSLLLELNYDTSLVFCYANPVVQAPGQDLECDYRCVELFKVPARMSLRSVLLERCTTFELPNEPEERLQAETRANSRYLWDSVQFMIDKRTEWWGQS